MTLARLISERSRHTRTRLDCTDGARVEPRVSSLVPHLHVGKGGVDAAAVDVEGGDGHGVSFGSRWYSAPSRSIRQWGGVLEHPAYSDAWAAYGLPDPPTGAHGWVRGICGGWSCYVEQARYGHPAKKATWLYAFGVDLPDLRWGHVPDTEVTAAVSWCGNRTWKHSDRPRVDKKAASASPPDFAQALIAIARTARKAA